MAATKAKKWSAHVNQTSNALDIEPNTFTQSDPHKIARAVEHDAAASERRKSSPYRSAMSMLTFYINRAGKNLSAKQRKVLADAKDVLRDEFGPGGRSASTKASAKKAAPKKATRKKAATKK